VFSGEDPISEIARRTTLSRNTIKKWIKESIRAELKYTRSLRLIR